MTVCWSRFCHTPVSYFFSASQSYSDQVLQHQYSWPENISPGYLCVSCICPTKAGTEAERDFITCSMLQSWYSAGWELEHRICLQVLCSDPDALRKAQCKATLPCLESRGLFQRGDDQCQSLKKRQGFGQEAGIRESGLGKAEEGIPVSTLCLFLFRLDCYGGRGLDISPMWK